MDWPFTRWCDELRLQVAAVDRVPKLDNSNCWFVQEGQAVVVSKKYPPGGMNRIPRIRQFP